MANIEIRQETPTAFYIKVHDTDNVAIIVNDNGLKAGTRFPDGLELIEHIPQGHKVALLDIPANGEIIRYGEVIGYAVRAIPRGSWIDESMVVLPEAPPLHTNHHPNVTVAAWRRGDYRRHHYWRRDVFSASGHVRGVVFLVNGGADLYLVLYAAFRLDDSGS